MIIKKYQLLSVESAILVIPASGEPVIRDPPLRGAQSIRQPLTPNKPHKTQAPQLAPKPSIAQIEADWVYERQSSPNSTAHKVTLELKLLK